MASSAVAHFGTVTDQPVTASDKRLFDERYQLASDRTLESVNYPALLLRACGARFLRAGLSPARASRVAVPPPCMGVAWPLPVATGSDRRSWLILGGLPHVTPEVSRGFSRPGVHHVTVRGFGRSLLSPGGSGACHPSPSSGPVYGGPSGRPVWPPGLHHTVGVGEAKSSRDGGYASHRRAPPRPSGRTAVRPHGRGLRAASKLMVTRGGCR